MIPHFEKTLCNVAQKMYSESKISSMRLLKITVWLGKDTAWLGKTFFIKLNPISDYGKLWGGAFLDRIINTLLFHHIKDH